MGEQFKKIKDNVQSFWTNLSKKNRIILVGGVVSILLISLFFTILLNRVEYGVLYSDLSGQETAEIYSKLQELGEDVKLEKSAIMVPVDRVPSLQMQMSIDGYPKTGFNHDIFKDNVDFMSTDYDRQVYNKIMLQENLVTAIKTIQGVRNAYVTINIPSQDDFVLQENRLEASAAVLIEPTPGEVLTAPQIKGIEELVAKSVPGLTKENISIVDNTGKYLSYDDMMSGNKSDEERDKYRLRLDLQKQLDSMLISKVQSPLEKVYGKDNVAVSASVSIDYDIKKSEEKVFSPSTQDPTTGAESGMKTHEDEKLTTESSSLASGVPGENDNADIPEYPNNQTDTSTVKSQEKSTDYAVSSLLEQYEKDGFNVKEMSVAVLVNNENMTDVEIKNMTKTVAKAAGIAEDNVSVMGIKFIETKADTSMAQVEKITYISLIVAGVLLLIVIFAVLIMSAMRRKKGKKEEKQLEEQLAQMQMAREQNISDEFTNAAINAISSKDEQEDNSVKPLDVVETKEVQLKKEIKDFTATNPEIVAQLLRVWLKGDEE